VCGGPQDLEEPVDGDEVAEANQRLMERAVAEGANEHELALLRRILGE